MLSKIHKNNHWLLIGIFILSLVIRLLYISQLVTAPVFSGLVLDTEEFDNLAIHILNHNFTHPDFLYVNPFYPFFLAFLYAIFGHHHLAVVLIQAILDSISCLIIYFTASVLFNKKVALISAFIYACYGLAIFYTGLLLAPTLIIFMILTFTALFIHAEKSGQTYQYILSGISFGLVALTRPNIILFLFVLPFWFLLKDKKRQQNRRKQFQRLFLFFIGISIPLIPIAVRNYFIENRFSPFSAHGGINFYLGNNPNATGIFMSPEGISYSPVEQIKSSVLLAEKETGQELSIHQASRYWLEKGLCYIRDNPYNALKLYVRKFALFWRKEEIPLNTNYSLCQTLIPILRFPFFSFGLIAPFALLGIILSLNKKHIFIPLFILSYMTSVIIFFVSARYRIPIVPFLIMSAIYALFEFFNLIKNKKRGKVILLFFLIILLYLGINIKSEHFQASFRTTDYNNLGVAYYNQGQYEKAIEEFNKIILIDSNHVQAHFNLGLVYFQLGRFDEAVQNFQKTISLDSTFYFAHTNLGFLYFSQKQYDKAIEILKQAIVLNPRYDRVHYNLGNVYSELQMMDQAIGEYQKAIDINPNYLDALNHLADLYLQKSQYQEAVTCWERILEMDPDQTNALEKITRIKKILYP
ncbi:tetratricopeptide repeat protein [bacterium]|nr:tetratricopeptide repeat protein [bacterium]